ncbi:MAG: outer membrane lipoprotein chaperone LolA [Francisella sp.]
MKKVIIYFIFFLSIINISFADPSNSLIEKIKNINSMSANFTQKMIDGQNNNNVNSKGYMTLKKPQYFKWETTSPNKQIIISNGEKLFIYDGDLEQLIIKKVSNDIAQYPYLILLSKNADNINKLFKVSQKGENTYILKPKDDQMIDNIKIQFTPTNQLKYLEISTSLHQLTQIDFSNTKINENINNTTFNFKAPKGTDIIDETKDK